MLNEIDIKPGEQRSIDWQGQFLPALLPYAGTADDTSFAVFRGIRYSLPIALMLWLLIALLIYAGH